MTIRITCFDARDVFARCFVATRGFHGKLNAHLFVVLRIAVLQIGFTAERKIALIKVRCLNVVLDGCRVDLVWVSLARVFSRLTAFVRQAGCVAIVGIFDACPQAACGDQNQG